MSEPALARRFWWGLKATVAVGLLGLLLSNIDWVQLEGTLERTDPALLALSVAPFAGIVFCEVARLGVVFRDMGLGLGQALRLQVVGSLFGQFLPGQLGSDLYKALSLRALGHGVARPALLLALLRLAGLLVVLAGAGLAMALHAELISGWLAADTLAFSPVAMRTGLLVLAALGIAIGVLTRVAPRRLRRRLQRLLLRVRRYARQRPPPGILAPRVAAILAWSVLALAARVLFLACLIHAVGADVPLAGALLVTTIAVLGTMLPISFAGLGVREALIVFFLSELGVTYEQGVMVAFASRALLVLLSLSGAVWWMAGRRAG